MDEVKPTTDNSTNTPDGPTPTGDGGGSFIGQLLRETLTTIIPALILALLINLFLAQATIVQGQSMEPTLYPSERVVIEKVTYRLFHGPHRGDIVVLRTLRTGPEMLIKRVVGLPGETISSRNGQVMINSRLLTEDWASLPGGMDIPPTVVPPGSVFVLGDNRGASNDSRSFGPVPIDGIIGRAWFIYWPLGQIGLVN